jgi:hypothetical protein
LFATEPAVLPKTCRWEELMGGSIGAPTPFGKPKSSPSRRRRNLYSVLGQITERDMQLLLQLYEHKVLTTHHIHDLHFSSEHRARKRLRQLYDRSVIDRFRPPQHPGSQPHHYYLDDLGARLVAGYLGVDLKELRFRKDRIFRLARGQFLEHLRDANGFFGSLVRACRHSDSGTRLAVWYGERRAKTLWIRPDGMGILVNPGGAVGFWLEVDRGTEPHERLRDKFDRYAHPRLPSQSLPHAVLFCFKTEGREARARTVLWDLPDLAVATTTMGRHRADPLGPIWLPAGAERRLPLMDLPIPERTEFRVDEGRSLVPSEDDYRGPGWW